MRALITVLACLLSTLSVSTVHAVTVVVPDNFPTIQAAINSAATTTVQVKNGTYTENLVINHGVIIEPYPSSFIFVATPTLNGSISIPEPTADGQVVVRGFRITGSIHITDLFYGGAHAVEIALDGCRLDGGIDQGAVAIGTETSRLLARGCIIGTAVSIHSQWINWVNNVVLSGGMTYRDNGGVNIVNSLFTGTATSPALLADVDETPSALIGFNTFSGAGDGLVLTRPDDVFVRGNTVDQVGGDGIRAEVGSGASTSAHFIGNVVRKPGGDGMELAIDTADLDGNIVTNAGGRGIVRSVLGTCLNNRVISSNAAGMTLGNATDVHGNVIGRSGGPGLVIAEGVSGYSVANNTVYLSAGNGLDLAGTGSGPNVHNNISYGNSNRGLAWTGAGTPTLACNDWFGNAGGAVFGTPVGATDLAVIPGFCNLVLNDVHIAMSSALVASPCWQVGAEGIGCAGPVSVDPVNEGSRLGFRASPQPTSGSVVFSWPEQAGASEIEIYDAQGALRWSSTLARAQQSVRWSGNDRGGRQVEPGIYFARLLGKETKGIKFAVIR